MDRPIKPRFPEDIKIRCLLWCDRRCCLCKKPCGVDIELAHIDQNIIGREINEIDNAIPLCYDCHAKIGHYNDKHPKGNKYKPKELRSRREQVFEEFTRHLVPLMNFQITQVLMGGGLRKFPDVGFEIGHLENRLPVKVFSSVILRNGKKVHSPNGHYAKEVPWKMNPGFKTQGHFPIPESLIKPGGRISATVNIEIVDEYGRSHKLLPMEWVYEIETARDWWYNP